MADTFPYGYKADANGVQGMGTMVTMEQMEAKKTVYMLNPEFWRRYRALMIYALQCGQHLGVGTGWRVQPNPPPPGFAMPGNSNHEGFPADGKAGGAVAIDTVCAPAWPWMEKNLARYGLRSFNQPSSTGYKGTNEPWHIQPAEIPASRAKRKEPWNLKTFALPGDSGTTPAPEPPKPPPAGSDWWTPLIKSLPVVVKGNTGLPTKRVQHFLALAGIFDPTNTGNFDGQFGTGTENGVKTFEGQHRITQDGKVDTTVWELFMASGDGIPTLVKGNVGTDVMRMQRMLSANGFMNASNQANFDGQFGSGTEQALKQFQTSRKLTADGMCGKNSWTSLLNG